MDKREKVIKGLECCLSGPMQCEKCPYKTDVDISIPHCVRDLRKNAIELLKAQEPVLLENQHKPYGHFINTNSPWISRCPECGKKIDGKQTRFCKYCGQAVKWE